LAVFLDPSLTAGDLGPTIKAVMDEYITTRSEIENILKLERREPPAERQFSLGLQLAGLRGSLRRASSIINYISSYIRDPIDPASIRTKKWINETVSQYLGLAGSLLETLRKDKDYGKPFTKLYDELVGLKLFDKPYEIKNGGSGLNLPLEAYVPSSDKIRNGSLSLPLETMLDEDE